MSGVDGGDAGCAGGCGTAGCGVSGCGVAGCGVAGCAGDCVKAVEHLRTRVAMMGKINAALMDRVERSMNSAGDSYAIFESNIAMQRVIAERTGELERTNTVLSDEIAVRRATQRHLELARDQAEAASRAKSEFLANMSHEIRTPMTAILGYADLALDDLGDPARAAEHLGVIRRAGGHLLTIINDILDLSKLDAGQMRADAGPTDLGALCHGVGENLAVNAEAKGLALRVVVEPAAMVTVLTDPTRARQILFNLIGNAVKFTNEGSVMVRADYDAPSQMATVSVTDTGMGIDATDHESIFAPFQQADSSATRRHGGTGLGLSIARRMARMLGGDITVVSRPGAGSVFTVTMHAPLAAAGPAAGSAAGLAGGLDAVSTAPARADAGDGPLAGMRVLLAEDGQDNQRLLGFMLRRAGASVELATDGVEAVAMVRGAEPGFHLVIMDMQMPSMDGYEATRRIKAAGFVCPVIAMTAHAMAGDRAKCLAAGCDAYLTKPVDRAALVETCRRLGGAGASRAA